MTNNNGPAHEDRKEDGKLSGNPAQKRRWNYLQRGILFLAGAVITAIIGSLVVAHFDKADLRAYLTSVSIDSPTLESQEFERSIREQQGRYAYGSNYARNSRLMELTRASDWLPNLDAKSFDAYLSEVYSVRRIAGDDAEDIKSLGIGMAKWPPEITELNLDIVYTVLRENAGLVMGQMFGTVRRGQSVFKRESIDPKGKKPLYLITTADDGDIYVDSGTSRLPMLWNEHCREDGNRKDVCRLAAIRLANALAYDVVDDLNDVKVLIEKILKSGDTFSEALRESEDEIERFSYWRLTVTLSNNGKDPIAISPWATMVVQPPPSQKSGLNPIAPSSDGEVTPPINIAVQVVETKMAKTGVGPKELDYEQASQAPAVIEGGKAVSITMRSVERISASKEGEQALQVFKGEHASVTLSLLPLTALTSNGKPRRTVVTQAIEFKDLVISPR